MFDAQEATKATRTSRKIASWQRTFIETLAETGSVKRSCAEAGRDRGYVYRRRESDGKFAAAWEHALEDFADAVEDEAIRRAIEGEEKPIIREGKTVGTYRDKSDRLLEVLLRGAKPGKYAQRQDVTSGGERVSVQFYLPATDQEPGDGDDPAAIGAAGTLPGE